MFVRLARLQVAHVIVGVCVREWWQVGFIGNRRIVLPRRQRDRPERVLQRRRFRDAVCESEYLNAPVDAVAYGAGHHSGPDALACHSVWPTGVRLIPGKSTDSNVIWLYRLVRTFVTLTSTPPINQTLPTSGFVKSPMTPAPFPRCADS